MARKPARGSRRRFDPQTSRRIPPQVDPNGPEARKSMTKVDFSGVEAGFTPLPAGQYPVAFTKGEIKDSKSTPGAKVVNVELTVTDDAGEAASGRKLFLNWSLQPQALWRVKHDAIAFGLDPDDLDGPIDDFSEVIDVLKGREAIVDVTVDDYTKSNGQPGKRNSVTEVRESQLAIGRR